MTAPLYEIPVRKIDGTATTLGEHAGKVMLVVNVASECGLTPQYEQLEQLHEQYAAKGLAILGFPANEFGAQEPGSNADIAQFCSTKFGVKFPMYEKIVVKGADQHPLYAALTKAQPAARGDVDAFRTDLQKYGIDTGRPDEILWNFEKFLVDRHGTIVARFSPSMRPDDPELLNAVEAELAKA